MKDLIGWVFIVGVFLASGDLKAETPVRSEVIAPIRKATFDQNGKCRTRRQGGNPREVAGYLVFDGSQDGNRQVDPQIAVGGGFILHGTNSGLIIYDKQGKFVNGVSQNCFNKGIDPKLFFDAHNGVFGFDLWNPWDKEKKKPVNISISETNDPRGAWNTYPVPGPSGARWRWDRIQSEVDRLQFSWRANPNVCNEIGRGQGR